jgi:methyl-accepting chemotaxis protein
MMPADAGPGRLGHMAMTRTIALFVALSSAVLLAGCGDSKSPSDSASGAPTQTSTQAAAGTWANGVCSASADLRASVRNGQALQLDPGSSSTSLDQAKTQVRDRVTAVQQAAASLKSALKDVPEGADPQVTAAQQQLQTDSERVQTAVDQLGAAAGQVGAASTAIELAKALAAFKAALTATANDLETYVRSLRSTVNSTEQSLKNAFGAAPACQQLSASPTATTSP